MLLVNVRWHDFQINNKITIKHGIFGIKCSLLSLDQSQFSSVCVCFFFVMEMPFVRISS